MTEDNTAASAARNTATDAGPGPGHSPYIEAAQAFRYSLTLLHRELPEDDAARLGISRRPSGMAVAVHGIVAGGYLASWSRTSDAITWPLHAIAEAMGLDPIADSTGGKLAPGNGERGKQTRRRIRAALDELEARGALRVVITQRRRTLYALVEFPDVPEVWTDPTYRSRGDVAPEDAYPDGEGDRDEVTRSADRVEPVDLEPGGSTGSAPLPLEGASRSPVGEPDAPPRGSQPLPLTKKHKKNKQTDKQPNANAGTGTASVRPSVDQQQDQELPRGEAGRIPPDPERSAGKGSNGARVSRADSKHVTELVRAIPARAARAHPHTPEHLAASMLTHAGEQHRDVIGKLTRYLEARATDELTGHLAAAAARWNGEARSLPGLMLTWLRDLPEQPKHRPEEYRHGFPLRDAMTACGLAGTYGVLRHATFAAAAEAVLDAGHDPGRDADGFAATLAATVLQLVGPDDERDAGALRQLAGDAMPVPFVLPDVTPADDAAPERGVTALHRIGLGYPDARRQQPAAFAAGSGGVWT